MFNTSTEINTPITISFPRGGIPDVLPGNINIDVIIGDTPSVESVPAVEAVTGIITVEYTPTSAGIHHVVADDLVVANLTVVNQDIHEAVGTLLDVALGSWILDKGTDVLTLYTQQGAPMATYDVIDTTAQTSREKQ